MCEYLNSVKEFHETFNHPINNYKDDIELGVRQLRIKLLFEEIQELSVASDVKKTFLDLCKTVVDNSNDEEVDGNNVDKKEEVDALCDIQYILSGGVLVLGYQDNFENAFKEVHRSNMSKMCYNQKEVDDTIAYYKTKGVDAYSVSKGDGYIILREGDNKVLKNIYYSSADLEKYVI